MLPIRNLTPGPVLGRRTGCRSRCLNRRRRRLLLILILLVLYRSRSRLIRLNHLRLPTHHRIDLGHVHYPLPPLLLHLLLLGHGLIALLRRWARLNRLLLLVMLMWSNRLLVRLVLLLGLRRLILRLLTRVRSLLLLRALSHLSLLHSLCLHADVVR